MNNLESFQVVVLFEESGAAKVRPNQNVRVTFDAIPDLDRDGTVLAVAPGGVNISGFTNYYATILLSQTDPRLKNGLAAEVGVLVQELPDVLAVPSSAVIKNVKSPASEFSWRMARSANKNFSPGSWATTVPKSSRGSLKVNRSSQPRARNPAEKPERPNPGGWPSPLWGRLHLDR